MLMYSSSQRCVQTFYGPASVPNSGFLAVRTLGGEDIVHLCGYECNVCTGKQESFRISATGTLLEIDETYKVGVY